MHPDTLSVYRLRFENKVLKSRGNAFQDLFSDIMERCYPSDFLRTRPWGRMGDRKNDGYIFSERHLFQVYAPNELNAEAAITKINEDFNGALPYWEEHFNRWSFVHNSMDGCGPHIGQELLRLDKQHQAIMIRPFNPTDLEKKLFSLSDDNISAILGTPFQPVRPAQITFEDIKHVLEQLASSLPDYQLASIHEVPANKLNVNGLNDNSKNLLKMGMNYAPRVREFFATYRFDPQLGTRVAKVLNDEYTRLRSLKLSPNTIFSRLFDFVKCHQDSSESATLAVLAYLFECCDIFEPVEVN